MQTTMQYQQASQYILKELILSIVKITNIHIQSKTKYLNLNKIIILIIKYCLYYYYYNLVKGVCIQFDLSV